MIVKRAPGIGVGVSYPAEGGVVIQGGPSRCTIFCMGRGGNLGGGSLKKKNRYRGNLISEGGPKNRNQGNFGGGPKICNAIKKIEIREI